MALSRDQRLLFRTTMGNTKAVCGVIKTRVLGSASAPSPFDRFPTSITARARPTSAQRAFFAECRNVARPQMHVANRGLPVVMTSLRRLGHLTRHSRIGFGHVSTHRVRLAMSVC